MLDFYQSEFAKLLEQHLGSLAEVLQTHIVLAPENVEGDLAFPCFKIAKEFSKSPADLAKELAEKLNATQHSEKGNQLFSAFVAVGPYVNASITSATFAQHIITTIWEQKADYGKGSATGKQILVEGRNINTHKAVHIGHLRNILVSEAVARIQKFAGNEVIKCCYPGDIGAHVAKWIWYYLNFTSQILPTEQFTKWVGQLYMQATLKVDENPDVYKADIEALQKQLEEGEPTLTQIWQETRQRCLTDLQHILAELGSEQFDKRYFESEVEKPGIQIVQQMLADGLAQYSQGAIAINLEERNLGRFLLLKSTGASLYSTKDIALAYQKKADFPQYTTSLYVVGSEQEHHFQQLFKTLALIGFEANSLHHLSYGLLDLKDGKMSSRAGNVILYEDFRDQMIAQAEEMMTERALSPEQKKLIARAVAFGAMKFRILLQDSEKKILFDPEQALSFEGETGPYLQYTYARISSIVRKFHEIHSEVQISPETIDYTLLDTPEDKQLLLQLSCFSEEIQKAAQTYKSNYVARYCLNIAQLFNSYYHHHKIMDEHNKHLTQARLALIQGVQQVLVNGFALLGIEKVENM